MHRHEEATVKTSAKSAEEEMASQHHSEENEGRHHQRRKKIEIPPPEEEGCWKKSQRQPRQRKNERGDLKEARNASDNHLSKPAAPPTHQDKSARIEAAAETRGGRAHATYDNETMTTFACGWTRQRRS